MDVAVKTTSQMLSTKINSINGFNPKELEFLYKALRLQDKINNSLEFKTRWLSAKPSHNNGMRQSEMYELWMSGYSRLSRTYDYQLNYALWKYKKKKGTYASTDMRTGNIFLNSIHYAYLMSKKHGHIYLSSSLAHEAMHSCFGFKDSWPDKRNSVPYTMGNIHRKIGEMHLIENQPITAITIK